MIPQAALPEAGFRVGADLEAYEPVGCGRCSQSGYRGRIGLFSVMGMSERIKELTIERRRRRPRSPRSRARRACSPCARTACEGPRRRHLDRRSRARRLLTQASADRAQAFGAQATIKRPMSIDFAAVLSRMVEERASDVHLTPGFPRRCACAAGSRRWRTTRR